jgi:hypothetical protein
MHHVADATALILLATVFVAFEATWPATVVGGLGHGYCCTEENM